jgi:dihydroorotate dehydrogenase (NAD+) catalytic subunit
MKAEDAIEFILVGASAIQIGTANLVNPKTGIEVINGIKKYLVENKINRVQKLIGLFKP